MAKANTAKFSPLYTPKALKVAKKAFIAEYGKDLDGAYRVFNRLDGNKDTPVRD